MYIKQVIIEGFKSYKEQVAIEPFSPKHNCIVGANGSGKTNFFNAIRFVLSDFTTQLKAEDRQRLLHDGAGQGALSAFVEIVFDNSDNRLPVDRDTVRLRRSIGLKKDEYFLDRKHITKPEVMNLLESAGFSRSNPYYVVQQGKIQALTVMKDTERLELLKEIGGTKVYDERRKESLKILVETASRQQQIEETVKYIDERLAELNSEREELVKYQEIDRTRRSLEYALYEKELSDIRTKLEEVEAARVKALAAAARVQEEAETAHGQQGDIEAQIQEFDRSLTALGVDKTETQALKHRTLKKQAQIQLDVQELSERLQSDVKIMEARKSELQKVESEVVRVQQHLEQSRPLFEQKLRDEEALINRVKDCEQRLEVLYKKQGNQSQYKTQKDKDIALQKEMQQKQDLLNKKNRQISSLEKEMEQLNSSTAGGSTDTEQLQTKLADALSNVDKLGESHNEIKKERDTLQNQRNAAWKKEEAREAEVQRITQDLRKREKHLEQAVPRDINRGLTAVKRIVKDHRIPGVHGSLIELFECEERFNTAVEVTAGTTLFNIVVDTDEIASRIITYLNAEKGGRLSFLPLNQLAKSSAPKYPSSEDAIPLISRLNFDPKFKPAFQSIFGKTLLCRSLDVASSMSRTAKLDCVTMDGDQVNKRGALTGGFHDVRHSRVSHMRSIKALGTQLEDLKSDQTGAKEEHRKLEQQITKLLSKLEQIQGQRTAASRAAEQIRSEIYEGEERQKNVTAQLSTKARLLRSAQETATRIEIQIQDLKEDLKTDVMAGLTSEQKKELEGLNPEIQRLKKEQVLAHQQRLEAEGTLQRQEVHLENNLEKRKRELTQELQAHDTQDRRNNLDQHRTQLAQLDQELSSAVNSLQGIESQIREKKKSRQALQVKVEELKAAQDAEERALQEQAKEMEQLTSKRHGLVEKREELSKKIREVGSLPSEAFDKYKGKRAKELQKLLQQSSEALKKFSHVNKKALDQFLQFTEQREDLSRRQEEVAKSKVKIEELIQGLDQKKDEDIERTFRGLAMHFKQIFSEIVQNGKGELIMIKNKDAIENPGADDGDLHKSVEKYSAVQVRVSFGGGGESKRMKQLSGGQKAVVALSLIFSIQRVDPAPFYLFDEIDAALDAQYRAAVGAMLSKQAAAHTQFVTTTFRPELVKVCSKVYGVTHKNRISCVDVITKEDALGFIEDFN